MVAENENRYHLLQSTDRNRTLLLEKDKCDKYDYLIAVACGAIGGIIDIFCVGAPGQSELGSWTDKRVDKAVMSFSKMVGWNPKEVQKGNIASAIGFLEKKFKVNYDQRYNKNVKELSKMSTKNHHIMSLGHSPDIIGLFFSVLNQFTSTSTFIAGGKFITINTETFELQGSNIISKLFCGIANWFGHIMSDIAGSSGRRRIAGDAGRGTGVGMPFYELLQFCKFGKFNVGKDKQDLATIAIRAFQEGYDVRFGLTMAIPVVITELSIRLIWAIRRYYQFRKPLKECIPTTRHADLRIMLIVGHGTLCVMDGADAAIRSGGNFLFFFMRLNLVGWFRLCTLVLKEVFIRIGIAADLQMQIEAYKRINEALLTYLHELEKLDVELFIRETEEYNSTVIVFANANTVEELNKAILFTFRRMGINKPWEGDFDEHMSNRNGTLEFK